MESNTTLTSFSPSKYAISFLIWNSSRKCCCPLTNPARVKRQFSGTFSQDWIVPMATVLRNLGTEHAWVVHGSDGLDELTTTGPSFVAELKDGKIKTFEISPEDAGINLAKPEDLEGGNPDENARALRAVMSGEHGPYRDIVIYNTAAALLVAQKSKDLMDGVALAASAIDNGQALKTLNNLNILNARKSKPEVI